ncbi:MAG: DoxX family protein [Actinomycetota bacterium]|nr:DoxX family protein [Actinomycetota bacterium]
MDVVLWIIAATLAAAFGAAGVMKLAQPKQKLAASGMAWVNDFSQGAIRAISSLEVLAAIGLVLPPLLDLAPVLTPLAALGLVLLMVGAAITHLRRSEQPMVIVNAVLGILAAVVAWGRFGPYEF